MLQADDALGRGFADYGEERAGHDQTSQPAGHSEQRDFGGVVSHQLRAAGTQRRANADFVFAAGRAGEPQVGDIGPGDQQDAEHGAEQGPRHGAGVPAEEVAERRHFQADFLAEFRVDGGQEVGEEWRERGFGLGNGGAGFEPSEGRDHGDRLALAFDGMVEALGDKDVHFGERRELEGCRQHADDGGGRAIEQYLAAGDSRVGGVAFLPERVRDDGHPGAARLVFFRPEITAGGEIDAEQRQKRGFHRCAGQAHRVGLGEVAIGSTAGGGEGFEGSAFLLPFGIVAAEENGVVEYGCDRANSHQAIAVGVGEAAEEDAVGHAEDGARGSDAEGESERGGDGKGGRAAQAAQGEAQLPRGGFRGGRDGADVHAAGVLVDDSGAAELFVRGGEGVARGHSLLLEFGGAHLEVRPHFVRADRDRGRVCANGSTNCSCELQHSADAEAE